MSPTGAVRVRTAGSTSPYAAGSDPAHGRRGAARERGKLGPREILRRPDPGENLVGGIGEPGGVGEVVQPPGLVDRVAEPAEPADGVRVPHRDLGECEVIVG